MLGQAGINKAGMSRLTGGVASSGCDVRAKLLQLWQRAVLVRKVTGSERLGKG